MAKFVDLTGKKFGLWTVVSRAENNSTGGAQWFCICNCGTKKILSTSALNSGKTLSCGCSKSKNNNVGKTYGDLTTIRFLGYYKKNPKWLCRCSCGNEVELYENKLKQSINPNCGSAVHKKFVGKRFNRLVVTKDYITEHGKRKYLCMCDCGNQIYVPVSNLNSGNTKSCGCLSKEVTSERNYKHGHYGERIYNIWSKMLSRCEKKYETSYLRYGGKGITVCEEWKDFTNFYNWAINNGYSDDLTIDRIDNRKNYCPENCRWASYKQQARNQTSNVIVEYNGESKTLSEWAELFSLPYKTVHLRYRRYNWDISKTLNTPIKGKK